MPDRNRMRRLTAAWLGCSLAAFGACGRLDDRRPAELRTPPAVDGAGPSGESLDGVAVLLGRDLRVE